MYKGTVLQYLRRYIKNLQAEQLESYLLSGECTLHAIELEPLAIAEWISDIIPYTVDIQKVFCSKVEIKIPWAQIRTKPLLIAIQQMEMTVHVHDFREQEWAVQQASLQKNKILDAKLVEGGILGVTDKVLKQCELTWVDYVSAGLQARIEFCRINVLTYSPTRVPPPSPSTGSPDHTCPPPPTSPDISSGEPEKLPEPTLAFSIDIEGMFVAPCHHQSGWSVSYVDSPDQVYQHDKHEKLLRLSRLVTLKSLTVFSAGHSKTILSHSPGFRMRFTSEFTCVNLSRNKKKFCIPPFPSKSSSAIWMDRVNISSSCSCEISAFYALLQDLLAPVTVPFESLNKDNKHHHYSFNEDAIFAAESEADFSALHDHHHTSRAVSPVLPSEPLPVPVGVPKIAKKTAIVSGSSRHGKGGNEVKKIFSGLAREVRTNAEKVGEQAQMRTDKLVSQSKKVITNAFASVVFANRGNSNKAASSIEEEPVTVEGVIVGSPNRRRRFSSAGAESSAAISFSSEAYTDAVSGEDFELDPASDDSPSSYRAGGDASPRTLVVGHEDGFALWTQQDRASIDLSGGGEFEIETQLVVVDKISHTSVFHLHANEFGLVTSVNFGESKGVVSVIMKRLDLTSESQTPLTLGQMTTLASFSQAPDMFLSHARKLCATVLCPTEPVHACTAVSAASVSVTVTPASTEPQTVIFKISPKQVNQKGLCLKWKSRSPAPTRLFKGGVVETNRMQPFEGCMHGLSVGSSGWGTFFDLYGQCMQFAGDFPDTALDPVMRARICVRDADISTGPPMNWRITIPSGMMCRNIPKNAAGFAELLSGFQSLSPVPDLHFADGNMAAVSGAGQPAPLSDSSQRFPFDGAFVSCICGQESTNWSWALPTVCGASAKFPTRVKFPNGVLTSGGVVTERVWRQSLVEGTGEASEKHVVVPVAQFSALVEAKLQLVEQRALVDQLREQYHDVMEQMSKKNIFLKERWAEEAVQMSSKDSVVDILTEKACLLEKLLHEARDEKAMNDRALSELRSQSVADVAAAHKELLEETQKLSFKAADAAGVQEALTSLLARKDAEIQQLKQQREFLLGVGLKSTSSRFAQTESLT